MPTHSLTPSFRRILPALLAILCFAGVASAQMPAQATVTAAVDPASAKPGDTVKLNITIDVLDGFHAQSHTPSDDSYIPLTVKMTDAPGVAFGDIVYPKGVDEDYPNLGKLNVYTGKVVVTVPVTLKADAGGTVNVSGVVRYQACNDTACFPPQRAKFAVAVAVGGSGPATAPATRPAVVPPADEPPAVDPPAPAEAGSAFGFKLGANSYFTAFLSAFLVGIVFNAVPCVLPVVPLKIMGFYNAAQEDRRKCFLLGLAFSVGLVAFFGVLAVLVVGLKSMTWGGLFTNIYFTSGMALVLLVMAISQFGFFDINLPTAAYGFEVRHDTYVGNGLFGVMTAMLSTPCTIGPFSVLLAWALTQSALLGSLVIVVVGCGMAFPYLLLSAFPQVVRRFPKTGPIGEIVKQTLAFFVLATAFYFARPLLNRFVTPPLFWWTLFTIVLASMVFLVVRTSRSVGTPRAVGISGVLAVLVIAGTLLGTLRLAREPYEWTPYTDAALADATKAGKPVLIDFTADWCGNCHYLEAFVLNDPAVVKAVRASGAVLLKADVTHGTEAAVPLKDKLVPTGEIPLTAVYPADGRNPALLKGVYSADDLLTILGRNKTGG